RLINGSSAVHALIAEYTELALAETQQIAACNAIHDASSRLCRWLLQVSDRIESENVPLTQEFLAQMLGLRRTTLTLLAQVLQVKGFINYSRGKITIRDRQGLERNSCECYRVLRHNTLRDSLGLNNFRMAE